MALRRFLSSGIKPGELASKRGSRIAGEKEEVVVSVVQHDETVDSTTTQTLRLSNAVVDIEMCLLQLRAAA